MHEHNAGFMSVSLKIILRCPGLQSNAPFQPLHETTEEAKIDAYYKRTGTTKKYMEKASRERNAKGWFEQRGYTLHMIEQNGEKKHPATSVDRNKTGLKLESKQKWLF